MKYFVILIFTLISVKLSAQQKEFSLNESGKYIYYEVVDVKAVGKDTLMRRAKFFINKIYRNSIKQETLTDSSIVAKGKIIIDKTVLVAGHPSGEVSYNLTFEAREGKYRFWLTDFEYIPYQRDRYGNYVATTTIGTPLEKSPSKLNIAEWKSAVETSYEKVKKIGQEFKKFLSTSPIIIPVKKDKAVVTEKW
jgi:hypothetical protein